MALWGYGKDNGPHTWCKDFPACNGSHQSPCDLITSDKGITPHISNVNVSKTDTVFMHYPIASPNSCKVVNNKLTIMVDFNGQDNQFIIVKNEETNNSKKYYLKQFHFHTPSEHTINKKQFDLELHLVHASNDITPQLAVLGVFFTVQNSKNTTVHSNTNNVVIGSDGSRFLRQFLDCVPQNKGEKRLSNELDISNTLFSNEINNNLFFNYDGSLTTPPCSEGVNWFVNAKYNFVITKEELNKFQKCLDYIENYRPVQRTLHMNKCVALHTNTLPVEELELMEKEKEFVKNHGRDGHTRQRLVVLAVIVVLFAVTIGVAATKWDLMALLEVMML